MNLHHRNSLTGLLLGALALGACGDQPDTPSAATEAALPPMQRTIEGLLRPTTSSTLELENFKVCKYGSDATFSYSITNRDVVDYPNVPGDQTQPATANGTFSLTNGQCVILVGTSFLGADVSVTEVSAQAGFQLNRVEVETGTLVNNVIQPTNRTESGPTVKDFIAGTTGGGKRGVVAKFYNEPIPAGQIGNFVWRDDNNNGIQDPTEPGIGGVTVTLTGPNGTQSMPTDPTGYYLFTGLPAGDYTVTVTTPGGFTPSPSLQGGDATKDSNGSPASVNLPTASSVDLTIDFGFVPPPTGQLGNFVWRDNNNNGIQDAGEPGIPGVTVTLTGPGGTQTTTTDANGLYLFTGLSAGSYTVTVGTPAGFVASPSLQGGDTTKDSNGSPATVTLPTNSSSDLTIDFGFVPPLGQLGNFVWRDNNNNGIQDAGEPGIPGVTVTLTGPGGTQTTTTDANGLYLFTGLGAGSYTVTVTAPAGFAASPSLQGGDTTKDSNGSPATVTLPTNTSSDLTIDFGFVPPLGQLGNFVWLDANKNGIQDAGEAGIAGVTVTLTGPGGTQSMPTDLNGFYLFSGLGAGSYTVTVATPTGFVASPALQGGDTSKDSNGSPASVSLPTNISVDLTIDFGFYQPVVTGGQGCTPGYWRQPHHYDSWPAPYTPTTPFSAVFENAFPGLTLGQVVELNGGGLNALGRHTVAALLNAASAKVNYDLTAAQVINAFNAVFPGNTNSYNAQKDIFEGFNEQGCPLN